MELALSRVHLHLESEPITSEWSTRGRPRDEDQNSANLQNKTRAAMAERFGVSVRLINYFACISGRSPATSR